MRPIRHLGLSLARIRFVRRAIVERADLSPFHARPSFRLMLGVALIGLSMLIGWPLISLLTALAVYLAEPLLAVVGGPLAYGLSWAVYGAGMLIAGREALFYASAFNRWVVRVLVERMIGRPLPDLASPAKHRTKPAESDVAVTNEIDPRRR